MAPSSQELEPPGKPVRFILHSVSYRVRYQEYLNSDFPRIPLTSDVALFGELARLGGELIALHLFERRDRGEPIVSYPVPGSHTVGSGHPRYLAPGMPDPLTGAILEQGRVYINAGDPRTGSRAQYFDGVLPSVWEFHVGGYQVCYKWLRDRLRRSLSTRDVAHYSRMVRVIAETIEIMESVDDAIDESGGWPIT